MKNIWNNNDNIIVKESPWGWDIVGVKHRPPAELTHLTKGGKVLTKEQGNLVRSLPLYRQVELYSLRIFKTKGEAETILNNYTNGISRFKKKLKTKFKRK